MIGDETTLLCLRDAIRALAPGVTPVSCRWCLTGAKSHTRACLYARLCRLEAIKRKEFRRRYAEAS